MSNNRNYIKGRSKEYRIVNKLKKISYEIAFRSAGSHSPIDVVAINRKLKLVRFIQAKPKKFSKKEKLRLEEKYNWLNDEFLCSFEVI